MRATFSYASILRAVGQVLDQISVKSIAIHEEEGIVLRQTFAEVPPRVEYSLSERGHDLVDVIECMRCYGKQWLCDASQL